MINTEKIQSYMKERGIDGYLLYDFRGSNPVMNQLIGKKFTTRRACWFLPQKGEPTIIYHIIDRNAYEWLDCEKVMYITWQEYFASLEKVMAGAKVIAMDYSPAIPVVSAVDGGTIDIVRGMGKEVVSAADIFTLLTAIWTQENYESHIFASAEIQATKDAAFRLIGETLSRGGDINEYQVQQFIMDDFAKKGLIAADPAIVGVGENSSNSHYEPKKDKSSPICRGDLVLIDLWAKKNTGDSVYADITWMGYCGSDIPEKYVKIFDIAKASRLAACAFVKEQFEKKADIRGYMVDDVGRKVISDAGYGEYFVHRIGHSIGPGEDVHALGANMDNFETHDERAILPSTGFSVEPGIYLGEFGVRTETDMFVTADGKAIVTGGEQEEIIKIL
ncbi:MAG: M24 family metallopeptidase [Clostridia bacterium]